VENTRRKDTTIINIYLYRHQNIFHVEGHISRIIRTVQLFIAPAISNILKILQLNTAKKHGVQLNLINDERLKKYEIIILSEPNIRIADGELRIISIKYPN
jgi:hypothetical protein